MNKILLKLIKNDFTNDVQKKRNFANIRKFFDMNKKGEYTLDNQTWEDLDMDKVYEKLDKTYSSPGEAALYSMLRNPLVNEEGLKERSKLIESFKSDSKLRESLMKIFFNLNRDAKNCFLDMIDNDLVINKAKYYIYTIIGKVFPMIIILLAIFIDIKFMIMLFVLSFFNMLINSNERNTIKSNGILYLRKVIKASKKIESINNKDIINYKDKISSILKDIKDIDRGTRLIGFINMWDGVFEALSVIFLLEECAYYSISAKVKKEKESLMDLYYTIGELEALVSISSYQYNLKDQYTEPNFIEDITLNICEGVHPLIEDAVSNSISIENKGIVLTGTNMSGKSTFLRMLGVNILLAQTFNFALAKSYEAPFFNIVSSISPNDDLTKGKSFYMAEVESILRIIKALEKDVPVFCPIDEIFRGTNPIERISMSAEILTYINNRKSISLVATHDRELVDILKENYEFYYFSEDVDSKKGLSFDYKLKKGTSKSRNAIRLLEYMNYPKDIIDKAYKRSKSIEGFL
ncbi:DNA mismatch repair protein MutS [Clostridium sp. MSJ-4]|uniref:DNA mismatch repair protein MutS n=1 Tax=Clostridium simiarum TaxID=2841506 RepID=A0ABS6F310_9CLOT|nr:DNA mismatch repair protein MutS [Clostridium simiarum]MBU5592795.1 DNA mismatch repair protein MutS [Clostridium simiarum]